MNTEERRKQTYSNDRLGRLHVAGGRVEAVAVAALRHHQRRRQVLSVASGRRHRRQGRRRRRRRRGRGRGAARVEVQPQLAAAQHVGARPFSVAVLQRWFLRFFPRVGSFVWFRVFFEGSGLRIRRGG